MKQTVDRDLVITSLFYGKLHVTIHGRRCHSTSRSSYDAKTRVYVNDDVVYHADAMSSTQRGRLAQLDASLRELPSEQRYATRGENLDVDRLWDRRNRVYMQLARDVAASALTLLTTNGHVTEIVKQTRTCRYSRTAGCSCGCSPGVIAHDTLRVNGEPVDIWIDMPYVVAVDAEATASDGAR